MPGKQPYNWALARQLAEIPAQLLHHIHRSKPLSKPEKHLFGPAWRQYLLLWMPPADLLRQNGVVMLYHGGGWRVGWPALHPTLAEFFLKQGFPVIMPAYRLVPWAGHGEMREDLNLALQTTLRILHEKGLGDRKIVLGGMSAGATLAAHLAYDRAELSRLGLSQALFAGFFSLAGPLDLAKMPPFRAVTGYAGGKPGSAAFQIANPIRHLQRDERIPILLTHGTADAIVPIACSESFFQHYTGPRIFHRMPNKTHLDSLRFATDDTVTAALFQKWLAEVA
ncbi:MAG: alpha/beta hydrolase [Saprospiraceae bacterium]